MIRINLLPVRQVRKVQAGQRQMLLFVVLIVAELGAMGLLYKSESDDLAEQQRTLVQLQTDVAALKREVGDYERLHSQRARLISQRNVINALNAQRSGPVWVLRELSRLMSVSGRPTIDQKKLEQLLRVDPTAGFNPKWNPRRLWLEGVNEQGGNVTIIGKAKDYDDVAELLKRLNISEYFHNVQLKRNDSVIDGALGLKVVRFSMTCQVKY